MSTPSNVTEKLAEWAAELQFESIPRRVLDECKNQILSVIASVHAGHFSDSGRTISRIIKDWAGGKEATLMPSGERTSVHNAIFGNSALSMALDYDDYLFCGHTGHSAVLCTLALAEKHNVSGRDFLLAQVAANELAGRLGAATFSGRLNGRLASFVHLMGAAVAASRALGLDKKQTASAIGLALMQPSQGLWGGFLASEGKVVLAAQTAPLGVVAAELAAGGLRGPTDIIENDQGFLRAITEEPWFGAFEGLGKTWLTETLSFKLYPGCAYIDSTVDCILHLMRAHPIDARKVRAVNVAAGPPTVEIDALAAPYLHGADSTVIALNFSVAYNAAVAILDKELTPRQFLRERIKEKSVWDLAAKVHLTLDEEMARRGREQPLLRGKPGVDLGSIDLTGFRMSLGAKVRIEMEDGRTFEAEEEVPRGAAGRPPDERRQSVEDKFRRETRYTLRKEKMEKAIDLVQHLEHNAAAQVREIVRLSCSERS